MGQYTDKLTKGKGGDNGDGQAPGGSRDLWPCTTVFALRDAASGMELEQSITVTSLAVACSLGVCDVADFQGQPIDDLCLVVSSEPDSGEQSGNTTTFIVDREDLLRHAIGLMQRLIADLGPKRARDVIKSAGGYPLKTMGDA